VCSPGNDREVVEAGVRYRQRVVRRGGDVAGAQEQSQGAQDAIRVATGLGPAVFVGLGAF
jgi:hypothetical protein